MGAIAELWQGCENLTIASKYGFSDRYWFTPPGENPRVGGRSRRELEIDIRDAAHLPARRHHLFLPHLPDRPLGGPAGAPAEVVVVMGALTDLAGFFAVYPAKWPTWSVDMGRALVVTVQITAGAFALGLLIGLVVAIGRLSRVGTVRKAAFAYIEITRGVPALVILLLIYYGLVPFGLVFDAVPAAILGLGISAGGYIAEIFRAGIEATHRGQREAGLTIGMSPLMIYRYIIVPQATRIALPPLLNTLISVLKDSSLASLISAPEIMLRAKDISSSEFLPLHIFVFAGIMCFLLALPLSWAARLMERRLSAGLGARL
jgi:His/Glu/Gln/Arg/opine family amino acid ABC transporter permease subunit